MNPPATNTYGTVIGICWLVFMLVWAALAMVFGGGGRRRHAPAGSAVRLLIFASFFLALTYGASVQLRPFGDLSGRIAAAGAGLCIAGLAFAIWARVTLGRNWGMPMTLHEDPELVTSGPYRYVRHPIYTGLIAMQLGTALAYPLAALPCAVVIAYCVFSSGREEHDMERRFPGAYGEYKKRSKRLVPFLF